MAVCRCIKGELSATQYMDYILGMLFLKQMNDEFNAEKRVREEEFKEQGMVEEEIGELLNDSSIYGTLYVPEQARWEKLKKILDDTRNDFIERKRKLQEFIEREVEKGTKSQSRNLGLDEKEYAFFEIVKKYIVDEEGVVKEESENYIGNHVIELSKSIAIDVRKAVKENYAIDWANNQSKTNDIERVIFMMLNKNYFKRIKLNIRKSMVNPLLNLAKKHFSKLEEE